MCSSPPPHLPNVPSQQRACALHMPCAPAFDAPCADSQNSLESSAKMKSRPTLRQRIYAIIDSAPMEVVETVLAGIITVVIAAEYAGQPKVLPHGECLGAECVLGPRDRSNRWS